MSKIQKLMGAIMLLALWAGILSGFPARLQAGDELIGSQNSTALAQEPLTELIYLPILMRADPRVTPFGVETHSPLTTTSTYNRTNDLEVGAVRMSLRIKWRELQPVQGGPILWYLLENVERELRILNAADIDAVLVITDSPLWAVVTSPDDKGICDFDGDGIKEAPCSIDENGDGYGDGKSYCGAIARDKFDDFAAFMRQLVLRYKTPEYNVKIWELGNEPDVDPNYVPGDSIYGCWGDDQVDHYNGKYYGEMLQTVTPVIKAADPSAQVWIGGLLLAEPNTLSSYFFRGILVQGASSYFDAVPYHWYAWFDPKRDDHDLGWYASWEALGGGAYGKATYLKSFLPVGVSKQVIMDEVALGCDVRWAPGHCELVDGKVVLSQEFLQAQADFLPRAAMRALKGSVRQVHWFMLEENSWGYVGLLDMSRNPKPVYYAYQNLIRQYDEGTFAGEVYYRSDVEAYAVQRKDGLRLHVVWMRIDSTTTILVPQSELIAIYNRDGEVINKPAPSGGNYPINVGFSPIYLILTP